MPSELKMCSPVLVSDAKRNLFIMVFELMALWMGRKRSNEIVTPGGGTSSASTLTLSCSRLASLFLCVSN